VVVSDVFNVNDVVAMPSCRGAGPCQARAAHILIARICDEAGCCGGAEGCHRDKMILCPSDAHLLELLDGTLVNTTALVDQVCDVCESFYSASEMYGCTYDR